jgi:hypothetical protein
MHGRRATLGRLVSSLKRAAGVKPLRVWKEASIEGSMTPALLAEAAVATARLDTRGREEEKAAGRKAAAEAKPSELSIVRPPRRSTVTRFCRGKARERPVFSSWEAISAEALSRAVCRMCLAC